MKELCHYLQLLILSLCWEGSSSPLRANIVIWKNWFLRGNHSGHALGQFCIWLVEGYCRGIKGVIIYSDLIISCTVQILIASGTCGGARGLPMWSEVSRNRHMHTGCANLHTLPLATETWASTLALINTILNEARFNLQPHACAHTHHISHREALIKSYQPPFLKWSVASERSWEDL